MTENTETAVDAIVEALPGRTIAVPTEAVLVVLTLATYGAQDLTRKGIGKVKQIRANRKAKKIVVEVAETPATATS